MTGATRPDIPAVPTVAADAPAVTSPATGSVGRSATATGPAAASSEQLQVAISSAIEKAWWSPGTPASAKVMEIAGPLLERAEAAESERDRFREQARILGDERSEWACDRCNVIHPWRDGDRFTAACPDCGALMLPTSLSSRLLANARARAEAAEAKLAKLEAALCRHTHSFTDHAGVDLCGGCLRPSPCPDAALAEGGET